jgi:para-aminobenzoate synthetase
MGCSGGPLWCRVLYSLPAAAETAAGAAPDAGIGQQHDSATSSQRHQQVVQQQQQQHRQQGVATPGTLRVWSSDGAYQQQQQSVWDYLNQQLSRLQLAQDSWQAAAQLPFNFWGGFVGYLGYELKAECGGHLAHPSPAPDAGFFFADRLVVVDHHSGDVYLLAVSPAGSSSGSSSSSPQHQDAQQQQEAWLQEASCKAAACGGQKSWSVEAAGSSSSSRMRAGITGHRSDPVTPVTAPSPVPQPSTLPVAAAAQAAAAAASQVPVQLAHSRDQYLANVAACQEALHQGESYELCLTTALRLTQPPEPWTYYQALRRVNPAPYGAWMQFGPGGGAAAGSGLQQPVAGGHQQHQQQHLRQQQHQQQQQEEGDTGPTGQGAGCGLLQQQVEGLTICCSSPERFLRGQRGGLLEARPIKGTAPRSSDPVLDQALAAALVCNEKDRAENLMIVDLLRNDLGRVCEVGSVHVPGLIELESHATVHQLVSTVRGLRKQGVSCVDAVRAAFPGGSMTGAPKLRSMQILDYLEGQARGVYSGALGYFSINDTFDLNIVIRTAVFQGGQATVGAGGAVVVQSEPDKEFEEMQLKAASLVAAAAAAAAATATVEGGALNAPCGAVGVTSEGDKVAACAAG